MVSHFVVYDSTKQKENINKSKYCFVSLGKKELSSTNSEMILEFNAINVDQHNPSNFKANYTFFSEFGIEGTRIYQNRTCLYTYSSQGIAHGTVNSPRYPNSYPLNIMCTYVFNIEPNERILFTFNEFKLPNWIDKYEQSYSLMVLVFINSKNL